MNTTALLTFTLRNGVVVLASGTGAVTRGENGADRFDVHPHHFTNRKQAELRAAQLRADGINAAIYKSPFARPFYVQVF